MQPRHQQLQALLPRYPSITAPSLRAIINAASDECRDIALSHDPAVANVTLRAEAATMESSASKSKSRSKQFMGIFSRRRRAGTQDHSHAVAPDEPNVSTVPNILSTTEQPVVADLPTRTRTDRSSRLEKQTEMSSEAPVCCGNHFRCRPRHPFTSCLAPIALEQGL